MIEDESQTPAAAFERAVIGYTLNGEPLRKYSASRKNAADAMGLRYPYLGAEHAKILTDTSRYPGIKRDVAIPLWLCSIPDSSELTKDDVKARKWTPERAFQNPTQATAEAMAWADAQTWGDKNSEEFTDAAAVAFAIVLDVETSKFQVKIEGGGSGDGDSENPTV